MESGEVDCLIGSERIRLAAGDGMFIGSKVIHRFLSETDAKMPNILFLPELLAPQGSDLYEAYLLPVLQSGCSYLCFRPEQKPEAQILQDLCAVFRLAKMQSPDKLELFLAIFTLWQDFFQSMEPAFRRSPTKKGHAFAGANSDDDGVRRNAFSGEIITGRHRGFRQYQQKRSAALLPSGDSLDACPVSARLPPWPGKGSSGFN